MFSISTSCATRYILMKYMDLLVRNMVRNSISKRLQVRAIYILLYIKDMNFGMIIVKSMPHTLPPHLLFYARTSFSKSIYSQYKNYDLSFPYVSD